MYQALFADFMAKVQLKKWKADADLYELADVANAIWRESVTSFNISSI